jgi:CRP/FNR family transcriptional regulator
MIPKNSIQPLQTVREIPLFRGLSDDHWHQLSTIAEPADVEKGRMIFQEGDAAEGFYVVTGGKVKVFKLSAEGKEQILHIYGPGHPIGEVPVFSGNRFPANAMALVKSRLYYFPRKAFLALITEHPSLCMNMLAVLSMRLREFTTQIENLSLKEVPGRLAAYLLYLANEQQSPNKVRLPLSKGQLASLLGTIPETLSRIFSKMSGLGLIDVEGSEITLVDYEGLMDLAEIGKMGDG